MSEEKKKIQQMIAYVTFSIIIIFLAVVGFRTFLTLFNKSAAQVPRSYFIEASALDKELNEHIQTYELFKAEKPGKAEEEMEKIQALLKFKRQFNKDLLEKRN